MKHAYIFFLISLFLCSACDDKGNSKNQNDDESIVVGGFRFGSHKNKILEIAESMNYDIVPNGSYNFILKGNISALGIIWDEMQIMYDDKNGIKQIILTREYDTVTQEMKDNHFAALSALFPKAEKLPYTQSITAGDFTLESNYANIFDINDDRADGYSGQTYYILDKNQFSTLICSKVY